MSNNKSTPHITLCMIVKNEENTLPTLFKSIVDHVDSVCITDTGSTDNTKKVCKKYCGKKLKWTTFEWCHDFSAARNFNFSQADGDWLVWADADDEIKGAQNLRTLAENCEKDEINAVMFPYHYSMDEHGNTTVIQNRERLVRNNGMYRWIGKLHEAMLPDDPECKAILMKNIQWFHRSNEERSEDSKYRNLEILELAAEKEIEEDKVDPRTIFNLGNAYFTVEKYPNALACYQKYIPLSGWLEEIYLARHRSVLCLIAMGEIEAAKEHALLAMKDKPNYPDAFIDMGKACYAAHEYKEAIVWLTDALKKEYPELLPVVNPMEYTANVFWLLGHCHSSLDNLREARPYFIEYQKLIPSDDVKEVIGICDQAIKESDLVEAMTKVGKELNTLEFYELLPKKYLDYPSLLHDKNQFNTKTESTGKDIAIYCGKSVTKWDPTSEEKGGVGGSEEAIINLGRLLAKKGWNITVYGRPIKAGDYDGVHYAHYTDFNPRDKFDIFISWRMPSVHSVKINAKKHYLWLHDTTPEEMVAKHLDKIDKVIVLSEYHRSLYPNLPDNKFILSGNGIEPRQFNQTIDKDRNYCIYTSAPDRGLECLLRMWPKIKKECPDAELHWFYGWETFDKLHAYNKDKMAWKKEMLKLLDQPGVYDEGRVDHITIAKKYQEANLWLYPTEFTEIYCITADKAQAGGAYPITTHVAALAERVKHGKVYKVDDMYTNKKAQEEFILSTISKLKEPLDDRKEMTTYAQTECTWAKIADQWDKLFV